MKQIYNENVVGFLSAVVMIMLIPLGVEAQNGILGPRFVTYGQTASYTYSGSSIASPRWVTARQGASINSGQNGVNYTASITWDGDPFAGPDQVILLNGSTLVAQYDVYINCAGGGPATPTVTFSVSSNACGNKTITYTGTPPSGVQWYWLTDPNNLVSTNFSNTFVASTSGTYYVRAMRTGSKCWSTDHAQVVVTVNQPPPTPSPIIVSSNQCDAKTLTRPGSTGGNAWYWQGTNPQGQSTTTTSAQPYSATTSGTYYLRARSNPGCWSNASASAAVIVTKTPQAPSSSVGATTFRNGLPILLVNPVAEATAYRWYKDGVLLSAPTGPFYTPLEGSPTTTYQVSAVNQGCESPGRRSVTLTALPDPVIRTENNVPPVIAMGKPLTLKVNNTYDTYTWKKYPGDIVGTAATTAATSIGVYQVTVTLPDVGGSGISPLFFVVRGQGPQDLNYVVKNTITAGNVMSTNSIDDLTSSSLSQTVEYFDGLGRPAQTVITQGGPGEKDIVQPFIYDSLGREAIKYLPYVANDVSGWYKYGATGAPGVYSGSPHYSFYNESDPTTASSTMPFAVSVFEGSPLNRVIKQGAPGTDWQPDNVKGYGSTDHTLKKQYAVSWVNEVLYLQPTAAGGVKVGNTAYYKPNQLMKNGTRDEQQNEVIEYTDKDGLVVLKKVQVDAATYASTYYVYNELGQLSMVLPPEASRSIHDKLKPTWKTVTGVVLGTSSDANGLIKSAIASSYGNAGAVSSEILPANTDGWVEMVAEEKNTSRMIGLSATNVDHGVTIQYALELRNDGNIYIRENGSAGTFLSSYGTTTVVRISREAGIVKYYKDGVFLQSSTLPSTGSVMVDVAMQEAGATISNVTFSFAVQPILSTTVKNWAFWYQYDGRGRMTHKKVPGAGVIYMVYDRRDRLVLTQDSAQRESNYWSFTKYDMLNRPVLTGIKDTSALVSQALMQQAVNNHYAKGWTRYDEEYIGYSSTNIHGYSNRSYPVCTSGATVDENHYLSVTYYDQYDFRNGWYSDDYKYQTDALKLTVRGEEYEQKSTSFTRVRGQVTGSKIKILDDGVRGGYSWLKAVTYYDDKYRVVQTVLDNFKGGIDRQSTLYDFMGKPLLARTRHSEADVFWTDLVGTRVLGNRLFRNITNNTWGQSGAASVQLLPAGKDGWVEWTVSETNRSRMIGLSDQNLNANFTSIDYAIYLRDDGMLQIREEGVEKPASGTTVGAYKPGDVLRVARVGTAVKYYKNGVELYPAGASVSQKSSTTALLADVAFAHSQGTLVNVRSSFSTTHQIVNRRFEYDHAGRLMATYHGLGDRPEVLLARNTYNALGQLVDKDLHSANGAAFKQSVDYRYNIRGWLTSINDASLANNGTSNADESDVSRDYFGMNLGYNAVLHGIGNVPQYNGNISATTWSHNQGLGDVKQNGYVYTYDAMNRIKGSLFHEGTTSSWNALDKWRLAEADISYDLNGNIRSLIRNDRRTTSKVMDSLLYDYGTGTAQSNRLLKVADWGDKNTGFVDGSNTGVDYIYDGNGNLRRDLNKGIGTSTGDPDNYIAYNFLNLPQTVTKGENTIRYIYDATGRKLSQQVGVGGGMKQTDYVGEFVYENDALQFVNHEEGRVATVKTKLVYTNPCDNLDDVTGQGATLAAVTIDSETYVQATITATSRSGIFPVGDSVLVHAGERYKIRAKGYRAKGSASSSHAVNLLVTVNGKDLRWPGALVPAGVAAVKTESWIEQTVTVPAGGMYLKAGLVANSTVLAGEQLFLNEFEIIKLEETDPEYQYFLKDHLGNVRLAFTTKEDVDTSVATMEEAEAGLEQSQFLNYDEAVRVNQPIFDHTDTASTTYSTRLDGIENRYGLAKSLSVMPGDVIEAEVWGKYLDPNRDSLTVGLKEFLMSIAQGNAPAGTVIDGAGTGGAGSVVLPIAALMARGADTGNGPKAYLNYLLYDRNYKPLTQGYRRMTTEAEENGSNGPHESLSFKGANKIEIKEAGYIYLFLSYEPDQAAGDLMTEVYFDDFQVTHTKSPVIQADDYYPYGLTFNSHRRENVVSNYYKFNGKEEQDELGVGWLDFGARMYMPEIGRWGVVDAMSEEFYEWSTYKYAVDDPVNVIDPDGNCEKCLEFLQGVKQGAVNYVPNMAKGLANKPAQLVNAYASAFQGDFQPMLSMAAEGSGANVAFQGFKRTYDIGTNLLDGNFEEAGQGYGSHLAEGALAGAVEGLGQNFGKAGALSKIDDAAGNSNHGMEFLDDGAKMTEQPLQPGNGTFTVTPDGVILPKGAKIPSEFIENSGRTGSYGAKGANGRFVEKVRIDPATPPGKKGPNVSHYHLDKGAEHLTNNWPWF